MSLAGEPGLRGQTKYKALFIDNCLPCYTSPLNFTLTKVGLHILKNQATYYYEHWKVSCFDTCTFYVEMSVNAPNVIIKQ